MRAMSHTYEVAADIAHRAEVDNRGVGAVLQGLKNRGLVERRVQHEMGRAPRLYAWRLTS
jgi:predicted ArsR family transcriptional regulator